MPAKTRMFGRGFNNILYVVSNHNIIPILVLKFFFCQASTMKQLYQEVSYENASRFSYLIFRKVLLKPFHYRYLFTGIQKSAKEKILNLR